jgi:hypothetical protein
MNLDLVEARWRLGVFPPEGLPEVARRLQEEGRDGPAIRALAELRAPTRSRAASLFEDLLDGLDRRRIAWDVWDRCRELDHLGVFVALADRHERDREHRDLIEEGIRREARRLLDVSADGWRRGSPGRR